MALIHVDFFSEVLEMSSQMDVILPQTTSGQIGVKNLDEADHFPVLYLLHGMTDNQTTWQRNTSIERYASERGIAVVMPTCHLGWYTDMNIGFKYYTYIAKELPQLCSRFFPGISSERKDTFIAGNSMGGYGAFKIALLNPDKFTAAASLSGGLDASTTSKRNEDAFYPTLWEDIFGPADNIIGSDNDLFAVSERLSKSQVKAPSLYMWCGTEDFLYEQNISMRDHLKNLNFNLTYKETPGDHSWKYWDREIQDILDWFLKTRKEGN